MTSVFEAFVSCKPEAACSNCNTEEKDELLTSAIIERLEMASSAESYPVQSQPSPQASQPLSENPTGLHKLQVPPEFEGAQRRVFQALDDHLTSKDREDQQRCLQACVRSFTKSLLAGINVCVLLDDHRTRLAEARLDSDLTHLVLHVPHAQHPVALRCIEGIACPTPTWPTVSYSEESSLQCQATLTIVGGQYLTFVFDNTRVREYFEMCLKVLVIATGRETDEAAEKSPESEPKVEISSC